MDSSDASIYSFILQTVFPTVGVFTGIFLNFAPIRAVLKASRDGSLGDLNPTPWVFMLGNCTGWLAYAFLLQNVYVLLPNAAGFVLAIWLNIQAIKLQYENHRSSELQQAIIAALDDLDRSKHKTISKKVVTDLVEHVMMEDQAPVDMIDPATTAPVLADDVTDVEDRGHFSLVDQEGGLKEIAEEGTTTESNSSNYSTIATTSKENNIDEDSSPKDESKREDDDDGNWTMLGISNRAISFIPENVEAAVDYAGLIWDIAAQRTPAPASHEIMVVAISSFWLLLITLVVFTQEVWNESTRILIIGLTVNVNLIFFYGAPLSKIATVLETRCSKLIHIPTMICSLLNGSLWFVYGFAVQDYFIAVPNGLGAALGVVQLFFCLVFPRHRHYHHRHGDSSDYNDDGYTKVLGSDGETQSLPSVASSTTLSLPQESTPLI